MVLDFHNQFIFQHIFKTAGTTVARILTKLYKNESDVLCNGDDASTNSLQINLGSHYTLKEFTKLFPRLDLSKFFIFSFVRNPWDRAVSMYKHHQQEDYFCTYPIEERAEKARSFTFDRFLKTEWVHMPSQWEMITIDDLIAVKFIGRMENFKADLKSIFSTLNIHLNEEDFDLKLHESKNHNFARPEMNERIWWHYSWWYKNSQITFVAVRANKEIEYFGYVFDDKRAEMPAEIKEPYDRENIDFNG